MQVRRGERKSERGAEEEEVALINRLIAAFHGSETLEKLFHPPCLSSVALSFALASLGIAHALRMLDAHEKRHALFDDQPLHRARACFFITLEKSWRPVSLYGHSPEKSRKEIKDVASFPSHRL